MALDPGQNRAGPTPISGEAACPPRTARRVRAGLLRLGGSRLPLTIPYAVNKFLDESDVKARESKASLERYVDALAMAALAHARRL